MFVYILNKRTEINNKHKNTHTDGDFVDKKMHRIRLVTRMCCLISADGCFKLVPNRSLSSKRILCSSLPRAK